MKLDYVSNEIARMRVKIRAREREIDMLRRAGAGAAAAELLLVRMRAKADGLCRDREALRKLAPHFPGGFSGLSTQRRAAGFFNGSTPSQFAQTYRPRPPLVSSGTRSIGLPQSGQGFRIGWNAVGICTLPAVGEHNSEPPWGSSGFPRSRSVSAMGRGPPATPLSPSARRPQQHHLEPQLNSLPLRWRNFDSCKSMNLSCPAISI